MPKAIWDEAVAWCIRLDAEPLAPESKRELDRWLEADALHRKAFDRAQEVWGELDRLPQASRAKPQSLTQNDFVSKRPRRPIPAGGLLRFRRGAMAWTALAACVALIVMTVFAGDLSLRFRADHQTGVGQMRAITLADGSRVFLNTDSALAVDYAGDRRKVRLLTGEAEFQVAHDPDRPFVVHTEEGTATALGTAFVVRQDGGRTTVSVLENRVRVALHSDSMSFSKAVVLSPAQQVRMQTGQLTSAQPVSLEKVNAWRRGKLIFENRPLEEVIDEVNRYHRGWIRIVGTDLKTLTVNGVFRTDQPEGMVTALEESLGLRAVRITDYLVFLY
ncbi:FecR family protein [Nitrospina watsonii]|nr:FecR family protein [Nitrospina watsonii]